MRVEYVIRWNFKPKSYFHQMTAIGPAFGATLAETPRFSTEREANEMVLRFPTVAMVGAEVERVPARARKRGGK